MGPLSRGRLNSRPRRSRKRRCARCWPIFGCDDRPKPEVEAVVDSLLGEIGKALRSGERVDLRRFGSFVVKDKAARQGRNPKTGEPIQIAARKSATFKPSKELANSLVPPANSQAV